MLSDGEIRSIVLQLVQQLGGQIYWEQDSGEVLLSMPGEVEMPTLEVE